MTLILIATMSIKAQKIAFINTETILASIPEYQQVQQYLTSLADKYRAAIETEVKDIDQLYRTYQSQKATLSASARASSEQEIISKEKQTKEKEKIYFGEDGVMAKRSEELLNPIQDMVNKAIASVAHNGGYDLVIDLAAATGIVYQKPGNDISSLVIEMVKLSKNQ